MWKNLLKNDLLKWDIEFSENGKLSQRYFLSSWKWCEWCGPDGTICRLLHFNKLSKDDFTWFFVVSIYRVSHHQPIAYQSLDENKILYCIYCVSDFIYIQLSYKNTHIVCFGFCCAINLNQCFLNKLILNLNWMFINFHVCFVFWPQWNYHRTINQLQMGAATIHIPHRVAKNIFSVLKLILLQDLRFSHLLPSGQVVKDQLNISGKLRQRTVRKGIFKKYISNKLCTYGSRSHTKKSKRRPKNKSRHLEVNQPLLTSLAKFSLFYLSRFGGRKKKNERKCILSKKYVKYTKQDKIKGKSRLEANQRFLTSLAKLWLLYPLWGAGSSVGKRRGKKRKM